MSGCLHIKMLTAYHLAKCLASYFSANFLLQEQKVDEEFELLVLASDGLRHVVTNEVQSVSLSQTPIHKTPVCKFEVVKINL